MTTTTATDAEVTTETVTPEIASQLLDDMGGNRRLSDDRVEAYARDMSEGRWIPLASMIVIDEDGLLLDGQHRLAAVLQSGLSQMFIIRRGAPPSSISVIDSGRGRTAADTLRIEGHTYTSLITAAARLCLRYPHSTKKRPALTNAEIIDFVHANPDLVKLVHQHAPMHGHAHGWPSIAMLATIMFATPTAHQPTVEQFFRQVYWLEDPQQPAKNLVRWLQYRSRSVSKGERTNPWVMWQALVKSVNANYVGEEAAHLRASPKSKERLLHERRTFKDRSW